ncbi:MAG: Cytochrome c heme lyase subunit CcmH [Acidobacteria bacterium]|nr:Cytochrome c heme lyase subunit CcmH [Acidobacteriota bacterium]
MNGSTDWLSAIGILLSGVVIAFMFVYGSMRRRQTAAATMAPDTALRDLELRRDTLIAQLRELEESPVPNAEEQRRLEQQTAEVLRAIDGLQKAQTKRSAAPPSAGGAPSAAAPARGMNPAFKGFFWGVGSVVGLALLGWFVYSQANPRGAGDGLTGGGPPGQAPAAASTTTNPHPPKGADDPAVQSLSAEVAKNPGDLGARRQLAKALLDHENLMGAFEQTKAILAKEPGDATALTYQAIVRMAMGDAVSARQLLADATRSDPRFTDAWITLAWLNMQQGKSDEAAAAIEEAAARHPEDADRLHGILVQMRAKLAGAASGGDQAAAGSSMAPRPAATAADAAGGLHLTLSLDPSAKATPGAVLFVLARAAGVTSGPPAAVKRIDNPTFPLQVDLTSADSMLGQPLPASVRLEARLDSDGNATTKPPTDPKAAQDNVAAGSSVALVLK